MCIQLTRYNIVRNKTITPGFYGTFLLYRPETNRYNGRTVGRTNERTVRPNSSLLYTPKTCFVDYNHVIHVNMPTFLKNQRVKTLKCAFLKKEKEWIYRRRSILNINYVHWKSLFDVQTIISHVKIVIIWNWYFKSQCIQMYRNSLRPAPFYNQNNAAR